MSYSELPSSHLEQCLEMISKWRVTPEFSARCPECQCPDFQITDHSSRPHTEWFRLLCPNCGFDHFVTVSLGSASFTPEC